MAPEWYRRRTWSAEDATEFEEKLSRARSQRCEYLRIQALTLIAEGDRELAEPAIVLAQRALQEDPGGIFCPELFCIIARASAILGQEGDTIEYYRQAVDAEGKGKIRCCAYLEFAWFVVTQGISRLYNEVLKLVGESMEQPDLTFPVAQYKYFGVLACVSEALGDRDNAVRMARNAIKAANKEASPFSRHPRSGLVESKHTAIFEKLERLAR